MKMHTKDKKKDRLIVFSTILGMVVVLAVWGFQLRHMFTDTLAQEGGEVVNEYAQTVEELESFQNEFEERFPEMQENFENMLDALTQYQEEEQQAQQQAQENAINEIAQEAAEKLQEEAQAQEDAGAEDQTNE